MAEFRSKVSIVVSSLSPRPPPQMLINGVRINVGLIAVQNLGIFFVKLLTLIDWSIRADVQVRKSRNKFFSQYFSKKEYIQI